MHDVSDITDSVTISTLIAVNDLGPKVSMDKVSQFIGETEEPIPYLMLAADGYIELSGREVKITKKGEGTVKRMREELLRILKQSH